MGYLWIFIAAALLIPVVFFLIREPRNRTEETAPGDKGVTPLEPASDQPTPTEPSVNSARPEAVNKLPPG